MDSNAARGINASGSRGMTPAGQPARKPKKKPKATAGATTSRPTSRSGPMPAPYLATAPLPVSSLSQGRIDQLAGSSRTGMVLPSSYARPSLSQVHSAPGPSRPADPAPPPAPKRKKYAAGLLAPPAIMPGGQAATPRMQGQASPTLGPPLNSRRRSADRVGVGGTSVPVILTSGAPSGQGLASRRRSEDRLRELGQVNHSVMSLGLLGQIMETDPTAQEEPAPQSGRRRRRVVQGERSLVRRSTVTTREEGLALGLARGASMRRTNVWDDLPEPSDPPPAFPFPSSSTRLPPAFEAEAPRPATSPGAHSSASTERPRSPPPSFEQAIGLVPLPAPLTPSTEIQPSLDETGPGTPRARPSLSLDTAVAPLGGSGPPSTTSPTGTQWASAPSSPVRSESSHAPTDKSDEMDSPEAREDRRMWNADLLAGYTLAERVRRENDRRAGRDVRPRTPDRAQATRSTSASATPRAHQEILPVETESASDVPTSQTDAPLEVADATAIAANADEPTATRPSVQPASEGDQPSSSTPTLPASLVDPADVEITEDSATEEEKTVIPQTEVLDETAQTVPLETPSLELPIFHPPSASDSESSAAVGEAAQIEGTAPEASQQERPPSPIDQPGVEETPLPEEIASTPEASGIKAPEPLSTDTAEASTPSDSRSQSGSDRVIARSPPSRKLTRGKALRRQSSSPKGTPVRANSIRSRQSVKDSQPLFAGPGYTAAELRNLPIPIRAQQAHRSSAPDVLGLASGHDVVRPTRERFKSQPNIHGHDARDPGALPPHREAALKRRESALGRMERRIAHRPVREADPIVEDQREALVPIAKHIDPESRPLIDLNESWEDTLARSPNTEMRTLAATTAELLQLLEDDTVAESSAQGAAKAEVARAVSRMLDQQEAAATEGVAPRKKPPPPPITLRKKLSNSSGVQRKLSVLSTADSPIIVRTAPAPVDDATPTPLPSIAPPMPTRRPPPPPPRADSHDPSKGAPPLPPRLADSVTRPPLPMRQMSTVSTGASSVSDRQDPPSSPPVPAYRPRPRTSLSLRPRGPRPPPVPPRPWAKMPIQPDLGDEVIMRPPTNRTQSENSLVIDTTSPASSPVRSMSEHDLRSASATHQPRSPEYTDLDVYVSRLEGSGREYEGFAHLTSFLGPAKNPAATPEALATLLPGLIQVDSRRQNAAGKTKLKLSLLGVRVTKCPICLSQFKDKDTGVMLPKCTHVAHEVCARRWFREDWKCFVCREPLEAEGVV